MTNLLHNGLQWLSAKQKQHVSSKVVYCRDNDKHPVDAVLGRTRYESVDENGFTVTAHTIDFLIAAVDLSLVPQSGDLIVSGDSVHEVIQLGDDGCWCWCEPHGIRRRIHTNIYRGAEP